MSYHFWSVYGYGIKTDNIKPDKERLMNFINQAPFFGTDFKEWLKDFTDDPESVSLEAMEEYEDAYGNRGIAPIMSAVIFEVEHLDLMITDDVYGSTYLLLEPTYPWSLLSPEEQSLTEKSARELFLKYAKMLTDEEVLPDYQSAECGG